MGDRVKTIATLFSGFDGVSVGARAAGLEPAWGIERDAEITEVANHNLGHHVRVMDILDANPVKFEAPDILHASPPCPSFSTAKTNGQETALDIALAQKVAQFIDALRPRVFTLENVFGYRNSKSWAIIRKTLVECGYWMDVAHVNAADMGVPQTRKRMIVRAVHGGFVPHLPQAVPWAGWYAAIEDLIPTLPESRFAPWQLERLPEELQTFLLMTGATSSHPETRGTGVLEPNEPCNTICATSGRARAFLVAQGGYEGLVTTQAHEPAFTVTANTNQKNIRAYLVGDQHRQLRTHDEPAVTVRAGETGGAEPRAFLVDGQANEDGSSLTLRQQAEPSYTVTSSGTKRPARACVERGRVVKMTPRALARFQSFPDTYELSGKATLDCRGIGNACPPLLMRRIYEGLVNA
jgi:DNA-cytosine methyltransferase